MLNTTGYNVLAVLCIVAATTVALAGAGEADDLLAVGLVGLAGTIAGRGSSNV